MAEIRFDITLWGDASRYTYLSALLNALTLQRRHVIGANSPYDVEYTCMHYYIGARPDYVPSLCPYTEEHYNPTRHSFLYNSREPLNYWTKSFNLYYQANNATFQIHQIKEFYKSDHEYSDLAQHLGIIHLPYQVRIFMPRAFCENRFVRTL